MQKNIYKLTTKNNKINNTTMKPQQQTGPVLTFKPNQIFHRVTKLEIQTNHEKNITFQCNYSCKIEFVGICRNKIFIFVMSTF